MEIKAGIIVKLKSGGPDMTVKLVNSAGHWICSWFVELEVKEHHFTSSQLIKVAD